MTTRHPLLSAAPGPRSRVFGFDLLQQAKNDYLAHISSLQSQFGDVVLSRVGHEKIFDIHHPDLIRELMVSNADALIRWERGMEVFASVHGQSVLVTEGEKWKRQRRMLQPGFSTKRMEGYCELMSQTTRSAIDRLERQPVMDLEFEQWAQQLTMDVILQTLFGYSDAASGANAIAAVATISKVAMEEIFWPMSMPDWMPHKTKKRRAKKVLDDLIRSNIRKRREQLSSNPAIKNDVLGMLLSVRDDAGDGSGLSEEEIRDQCMTIFLAGHETTALALTWWAWLMAEHPQAMERAQREIDGVLQGRLATYGDVAQLHYLGWSLKEALRLYPPAPGLFTRRALRDIALGTWTIPKGAMVRVTPWVVHRDARWFDAPTRFIPERFDETTPFVNRNAYLPFGSGPRICIGSHFALTEMTLIAAHLLQRFSLRSRASPKPMLDVLLFPQGGMPLQLIARNS